MADSPFESSAVKPVRVDGFGYGGVAAGGDWDCRSPVRYGIGQDVQKQRCSVTAGEAPPADAGRACARDVATTVAGPGGDDVDDGVSASIPDQKSSRLQLPATPLNALAVAVALSVGLAATLYFTEKRPDSETDSAVARSAVKAASTGAAAVMSYAPASLESDLAAAKSHLTGEFLAYYSKFSEEVLRPTAEQKHITTKATVVQAAVSELHPDAAKVLVFVNQVSSSVEKPMVATGNSVVVSLTKSRGTWLISAFEPV